MLCAHSRRSGLGSGGTLVVGNDTALGSGTLTMAAGTTLGFSGDHTIANASSIAGDPIYDVAGGQTDTLSGVISDGASPGVVEKTSAGMLVLAGANTYSGGTIIDAGRYSAKSQN